LKLAEKLTVGIKKNAKNDGGSLRGEEHICKNAMSMTRKVVSDLVSCLAASSRPQISVAISVTVSARPATHTI
jgi:hypothetical protein